ncbi:hypothetical protein [Leptospira sarikeiensis]|uniref:Cys-rich protein n=1 Tax=Leptospira sarikeiensis TaxID=2484943 RepID=A0A4R9K1B1_9LEPT|nr:hypothetical protein [Leptospira sarikeiensis]TGL58500.1 hypothetical protein EHQ64_18495 [Leptospira sarikeiensis]
MTRIFPFLLAIVILGSLSCNSGERDIKGNALATFYANCTGGSYPACKNACENKYGTTVTTTNLAGLNTCLSSCNTSCNISTLCFQLAQSCKSDCDDYLNNCVFILSAVKFGQ